MTLTPILFLPDKAANTYLSETTPNSVITKEFLTRPSWSDYKLIPMWEEACVKTVQEQMRRLEMLKRDHESIPRREILTLAIALRRLAREVDWRCKRENKFLIDMASAIVKHYHMGTVSFGGPKAFEQSFNHLNQKLDVSHCSVCGRTLSNTVSIRIGIGPICRHKKFVKHPEATKK